MIVYEKTDFSSAKQSSIRFNLKGYQKVILVPCTFDKNIIASFEFEIFTSLPCSLRKLTAPDCTSIIGEWTQETAGGCFNHPSWINNKQYTITTSENLKIQLKQDSSTNYSIGFYVVKSSNGKKILYATWSNFTLKSKFLSSESVNLDLLVDGNKEETYLIIPCTFNPQELGKFTLSVFNKSNKRMELKEAENPYTEEIIANKWSYDSAGGCFNFSTWRNNPQFELSTPNDAEVVIILEQEDKIPYSSIGAYVIETSEPDCIQWKDPSKSSIISKAKFKNNISTCCTFTSKKEKYYTIIPCTFEPDHYRTFRLHVFVSLKEFDLNLLDNTTLTNGRLCEGEWTENSAGGSMNNETWPTNPHYLLYTDGEEPTEVTIVLSQKQQDKSLSNKPKIQSLQIFEAPTSPSLLNNNKKKENPKKISSKKSSLYPIGFSVTRADRFGLPHVEEIDDIVGRVTYEKNNDVFLNIKLPVSERPFVITPSTFQPNQYCKFVLQVFAEEESDVMLMPWTSSIEFDSDSDEYYDDDEDEEIYTDSSIYDSSIGSNSPSVNSSRESIRSKYQSDENILPFSVSTPERAGSKIHSLDSKNNQIDTYSQLLELVESEIEEKQKSSNDLSAFIQFGSDDDDDEIELDLYEMADQLSRLKDRIECLEDENNNYEENEQKLNENIENLTNEKDQLENQIENQNQTINQLKNQLKSLEDKNKLSEESSKKEIQRNHEMANNEKQKIIQQLEIKNQSIHQLEEKLEKSNNKKNQLNQQISKLQEEIENLQNQKENFQQSKLENDENLNQLKQENEKLLKQIDSLKEKHKNKNLILQEKDKEILLKNQEINKIKEENQDLKSENQTFKTQINNKEAELKNRMNEVENTKLNEAQFIEQIQLKNNLLIDFQNKIQALESIEKELRERIENKDKNFQEIQNENEKLKIEKKEFEDQLNSQIQKNNDLSNQLEQRNEKIHSLQAQIAKKKVEFVALKEEISSTKKKSQDHCDIIDSYEEKIDSLQQTITSTNENFENWKKSAENQEINYRDTISNLENEISSLKENLSKDNLSLDESKQQMDDLIKKHDQESEKQKQQIDDLNNQISSLNDKLEKAHENEKDLQEKIKTISVQPPPVSSLPVGSGTIRKKGTIRIKEGTIRLKKGDLPFNLDNTETNNEEREAPTSSPAPPPAPPSASKPPPPSAPSLGKLKRNSKSSNKKHIGTTSKKKSVLTAIRGGVNLRKTKPENAADKMKKSWIPFNVDKITQRRQAMEENEEESSDGFWSGEEEEEWETV